MSVKIPERNQCWIKSRQVIRSRTRERKIPLVRKHDDRCHQGRNQDPNWRACKKVPGASEPSASGLLNAHVKRLNLSNIQLSSSETKETAVRLSSIWVICIQFRLASVDAIFCSRYWFTLCVLNWTPSFGTLAPSFVHMLHLLHSCGHGEEQKIHGSMRFNETKR